MTAGDVLTFSITWFQSHHPIPAHAGRRRAGWTRRPPSPSTGPARCRYDGPYRADGACGRCSCSASSPTAGPAASSPHRPPRCPRSFGGVRNWDYRFCWLRDASLTLEALLSAGYEDEVELWRDWLLRAIAGDPQDTQIMYAVDGGRELPERELDPPARVRRLPPGPGRQRRRRPAPDRRPRRGDVGARARSRRRAVDDTARPGRCSASLVNELCEHWDEPDNGLWEIRGPRRHSPIPGSWCGWPWTAPSRASRGTVCAATVDKWRALCATRCARRSRARASTRSGTRSSSTTTRPRSTPRCCCITAVGFLPGDDPRVLGTIAAVEEDLMRDGLLTRYRTARRGRRRCRGRAPVPGLLVLARRRRTRWPAGSDDARELMDRLVGLANDVGLLSEEYDPVNGRMVGNFPQAFSHLALVGGDGPGPRASPQRRDVDRGRHADERWP